MSYHHCHGHQEVRRDASEGSVVPRSHCRGRLHNPLWLMFVVFTDLLAGGDFPSSLMAACSSFSISAMADPSLSREECWETVPWEWTTPVSWRGLSPTTLGSRESLGMGELSEEAM